MVPMPERDFQKTTALHLKGSFLMTHIGGPTGKYTARVRELFAASTLRFCCGHSHILKVMQVKNKNLLHLNPGAAGIHGFHQMHHVALKVDSKLKNMEVIELGKGKVSVVDLMSEQASSFLIKRLPKSKATSPTRARLKSGR